MKLFLVVNVDWFFLSHRLPIALEAQKRGYDVTVVAIDTGRGAEIAAMGLRFIPLPTNRKGLNPMKEVRIIRLLYRLYKTEKPDVVHHVALKPVIYGSLAARLCKNTRFVNAISGMGCLFADTERKSLLRKAVLGVFKVAFRNPALRFIFQNKDDRDLILALGVTSEKQVYLIEGSGVDLSAFRYAPEPAAETVQVVYTGRLLHDKGVNELVEAARLLRKQFGSGVEISLVGDIDDENRASLTKEEVLRWQEEGIVRWAGHQKDVYPVLQQSHIVVLPSYREGLPKSLIEACATGRPIVTTDVPGCRDVVQDGVNGFLVPARDGKALADALARLVSDPALRLQMGQAGRRIAEQRFSIESVINKTFAIYES